MTAFEALAGVTVGYNRTWENNNVSVCWKEVKEKFLIEKELIKSIINSEYTATKTGIFFTGWEDCTNDSISNVELHFKNSNSYDGIKSAAGRAGSLGIASGKSKEFPNKIPNTKKSWIEFYIFNGIDDEKLDFTEKVKYVALHEFGHLAGLIHEHELKEDSELRHAFIQTSLYNPNSIMDYSIEIQIYKSGLEFDLSELPTIKNDRNCKIYNDIGTRNTKAKMSMKLSHGDVHSLKCLYVYSENERESMCHPNYKI